MDLHASARRYASGLPAAVEEQPFGPDWDVFKVAGKVFMVRERELHELIRESYRLVVANLPRARRPVDPVRF